MKDFLKDSLSKSRKKSSNPKPKIPLAKRIIIAIGAILFLIAVVLFSTNIDQILKFFGVRADQATLEISLDPPEGPPGDPPIGPTQNLGPNESYTYHLNIKSIWGTHPVTGDPQPFKGIVRFIPPDLVSLYPDFIESVVIEVPEHPDTLGSPKNDPTNPMITITDSPDDCPMLGICNWRPPPADQEFVDPPVYLTITTKDYNPLMGDFEVNFEVNVILYYNPALGTISIPDPDDPPGEIPPSAPAQGTIYLEGEIPNPDFTLEILPPKDQTINAGSDAFYTIRLITNEFFGIADDGEITLSSAELDAAIDNGYFRDPFYTFGDNTGPGEYIVSIGPSEQVDVPLVIYTEPSLGSIVTIPFTVRGISEQVASYIMSGGDISTLSFIVTGEDNGSLTIDPVPDFSIVLGDVVVSTIYEDELLRDVVIPSGSISYNVTLNRINGFTGDVIVNSISLDNNWPTEIASYEFNNGGLFTYQDSDTQPAVLTIYITDTVDTQIIDITDFTIDGYGDIDRDSLPEHKESNPKTFSIVDYTLTIQDTPQIVGAGSDATYTIVITPENKFNDSLYLSMVEDLVALYPEYITGVDLHLGVIIITADATNISYDLIIHTNPASPGTNLDGIPFHVQGDSTGLNRHVESNEGILHITSQQDFTIQLTPIKNRIIPGGEATYTVTATGLLGFSDPIDLSTSWDIPNMPSYIASISFDDTTILPGDSIPGTPTILHIVTTPNAPPISSQNPEGQFRVIGISGTYPPRFADGRLDIVNFTIQIIDPAPDINGDSIRIISPGNETTYTVTVTRLNNFTEDIILSTDLISINGSINNLTFEGPEVIFIAGEYILQYTDSLIQFITLRVSVDDPAPSETIYFFIYGDATTNEGDTFQRQSNRGVLIITNDQNFSIKVIPDSLTVGPGGEAIYTVTLNTFFGFNGSVLLSTNAESFTGIATAEFGVNSLNGDGDNTTLTLTATDPADNATYTFTVYGDGNPDDIATHREDSADLVIYNHPLVPDFTISVTPETRTVAPGDTTSYTVSLTRINGFNEEVSLSTDLISLNSDVSSAIFTLNPLPPGIDETTLTVIVNDPASNSTTMFSVTGTSPSLIRSDTAELVVYQQPASGGGGGTVLVGGFTISVLPESYTVTPGGIAIYNEIVANLTGSFRGEVELTNNIIELNPDVESAIFEKLILSQANNWITLLRVITKSTATPGNTIFNVYGTSQFNNIKITAQDSALLIIQEEEIVEEIIPEEELPSTGPELTWLLFGLAALLITTITYNQLQLKLSYQKNK